MRRIKGRTVNKLFEEFPHLKKRYWSRYFWAGGYFCATVGQTTEEMIKQYLEHHFEPKPNDDFRMVTDKTRRSADAYPDFQSVTLKPTGFSRWLFSFGNCSAARLT